MTWDLSFLIYQLAIITIYPSQSWYKPKEKMCTECVIDWPAHSKHSINDSLANIIIREN